MKTTPLEKRIRFASRRAEARFLSPLEGYAEVTSRTEHRIDPLTGRVAIVGLNLEGKRASLYSETDEALLAELARSTRDRCLFCPERVEHVTPRYGTEAFPGSPDGRLRRGGCLLFPNLFPLTELHAVVALGAVHFRRLDEFTADLLADGLALAVECARIVSSRPSPPAFWVVCGNYLPPGGASVVHPHLQVLGSSQPLTAHATELERARAYHQEHGTCFFVDLVARELELGERLVGRSGPVTWVTAFAPRGNNELLGICDDVAQLTALDESHIGALARGLSHGLKTYASMRYSTFNLCLYSAPLGRDAECFRVYASLISRQSMVKDYRCDDYFLQKMLGTEILVDSPETFAASVRELSS